jgi:hypothetical protein
MAPAKKSEPAAAVEPVRRRTTSRARAPVAAPTANVATTTKAVKAGRTTKAAKVVTTTEAAGMVATKKAGRGAGKRIATDKMKIPAASAETTVKRAVTAKAVAPVAKAGDRKAGKKRGAIQA